MKNNIEEIIENLSPLTLRDVCVDNSIPLDDCIQTRNFLKITNELGKNGLLNTKEDIAKFAKFKDYPNAIIDMQAFVSDLQNYPEEYIVLSVSVTFEEVKCKFLERKDMISALKHRIYETNKESSKSQLESSVDETLIEFMKSR